MCNLASIAVPKFVKEDRTFDHDKLFEVTYRVTRNLNRVIDRNYYPIPEARNSNMRHRPIGLGVQGLADAFILMRFPFDSDEARQLNKDVFETIYYAACTASKDMAKEEGAYETFPGSPASEGKLQFDMWNVIRRTVGSGTSSRKKSRSTACATRCSWPPCPPLQRPKSSATTNVLSPTQATSTPVARCPVSSSWSTSTCCATS